MSIAKCVELKPEHTMNYDEVSSFHTTFAIYWKSCSSRVAAFDKPFMGTATPRSHPSFDVIDAFKLMNYSTLALPWT
jgi:hypothetical protein